MQLTCTVEQGESLRVLTVAGEVDVATAPEFEQALHEAVQDEPARVVVDLSGVTFFDSTGLHALELVRREVEGTGTDLRLVCPQPRIRRLFTMTSIEALFTFDESVAAARAAALPDR